MLAPPARAAFAKRRRRDRGTIRSSATGIAIVTRVPRDGVDTSVARICRAAGLSRLKNLEPPGPTIRYERDDPGELLHIDTKRLGRFDRVGHRITRDLQPA